MRYLAPLLLLALAAGCPPAQFPSEPDFAVRAARVADRIEESPDAADIVLEAEGITHEEYREGMFRIARDPQLTREFLEARRRPYTGRPAPTP